MTAKDGYQVYSAHALTNKLVEILKENPKSPVVIYTNMNNYKYLFEYLLPKLDKRRIKRINLYEDGLGELFTHADRFKEMIIPESDIPVAKNFYYGTENRKEPEHIKYMLHTFLSVTYHFFCVDEVRGREEYKNFFTSMRELS